MTTKEFLVEIDADAPRRFATISEDWNPLHTDPSYAAGTRFRRPILHGAFLAGLVSRMAGMHLPGKACLLRSMRLRFLAPVQPPVSVVVRGRIVTDDGDAGQVEVSIEDASSGTVYADATYEFSRHQHADTAPPEDPSFAGRALDPGSTDQAPILVTGASGSLGSAVLRALGDRGLGVSRDARDGWIQAPDLEALGDAPLPAAIDGIVHCAWPAPDNRRLLDLTRPRESVEHHLAAPFRQALGLARILADRGTPRAMLVLVGSTAADPGRHNYRMPLYTIAKSFVPALTRVLSLELAPSDRRCVAVTFDVLDGGMNAELSGRARLANTDRSPFGRIPNPDEAAAQILWVLGNRDFLASGATVSLTGGALP